MIPSWMPFGAIILFFGVLLVLKPLIKKRYCVLCVSVSLTWIGLLVLFWTKRFADLNTIALLMGQSILGIYFLLEKRLAEKWHLFRFPFLLTATFMGMLVLQNVSAWKEILMILIALWILFVLFFLLGNTAARKLVQRVIACCKDW